MRENGGSRITLCRKSAKIAQFLAHQIAAVARGEERASRRARDAFIKPGDSGRRGPRAIAASSMSVAKICTGATAVSVAMCSRNRMASE